MVDPRKLEKGKFYRVEFHMGDKMNWYTVQAINESHVLVLTKNGSKNGGSGMITTAKNIYEINESYARTGKLDPKHNEEALVFLMKEE